MRINKTKIQKDLDSDSDPEEGYLKNEERQDLHIAKAREKICTTDKDPL